jgi:hypothetical protein
MKLVRAQIQQMLPDMEEQLGDLNLVEEIEVDQVEEIVEGKTVENSELKTVEVDQIEEEIVELELLTRIHEVVIVEVVYKDKLYKI